MKQNEGVMGFSMLPLLIAEPGVSPDVRAALRAARRARGAEFERVAKEHAAALLVSEHGLDWADARELVELPGDYGVTVH